jgi:hypothetical protein
LTVSAGTSLRLLLCSTASVRRTSST